MSQERPVVVSSGERSTPENKLPRPKWLFALLAIPTFCMPLPVLILAGMFLFGRAKSLPVWIGWPVAAEIVITILLWPVYLFWVLLSKRLRVIDKILWAFIIIVLNVFGMPWFYVRMVRVYVGHKPGRKVVYAVLGSIAAVAAGLLVALASANAIYAKRFEAKVRAYREAGEKAQMIELIPGDTDVPDEENAATFYEKAYAKLNELPEDIRTKMAVMPSWKEWTQEQKVDAGSILIEVKDVRRLIREADARPRCRFRPGGYTPVTVPSSLKPTNRLGTFLSFHARAQLSVDNVSGAAEDCAMQLRLAAAYDRELKGSYTIMGFLTAKSTLRRLAETLDSGDPSEGSLRRLDEALGDADSREAAVFAMKCNRASGLLFFKEAISNVGSLGQFSFLPVGSEGGLLPAYFCRATLGRDGVWYLGLMDRYVACAAKPYWQSKAEREALNRELNDTMRNARLFMLSRTITPGLPRELEIMEETIARKSCAKLAVALRRCRMKHGSYPDTLDVLAPEFLDRLPVDPFSGKLPVYRREGGGFVIYSVGPEGKDHGGVENPEDQDHSDIVWKCSR